MRPLTLQIQAFGSFAGRECVRFDALAEVGLFVVSGPTGSGKTTIFDAMALALYGKVAGDRPLDVRSHHAPAGTDTVVELEFEVDRRRYRVWRRPAQERPKQRGSGMRQVPPAAELYEWTAAGWQGIVSQPTKVTERCIELVGLDLDQFQRVVLLPQGKFAEFLLSDTAKRQELLRQLFGSSLYSAATEWYQEESRRLHAEVAQVDIVIDHHRQSARDDVRDVQRQIPPQPDGTLFFVGAEELADDASIDAIDAALQACVPQFALRQAEQVERLATATAAAGEATAAREAARRFDRAAEIALRRSELLAQQTDIERAGARAAAARAAMPVLAAHRQCAAADAQADAACASERRERDTVASGFAVLALPAPASAGAAATTLAVRAAQLDALLVQLDEVASARRAAAVSAARLDRSIADMAAADATVQQATSDHDDAHRLHEDVRSRAARLDAAESAAFIAAAAVQQRDRLDVLTSAIIDANESARSCAAREQQLVHRFALGAAPRLAAQLHPGEPCMVCGSTEHPAPAAHADDVEPVDLQQLADARDAVDAARDRASAMVAEVAVLRRDLGAVAGEPAEMARARLQEATSAAQDARTAAEQLGGAARRLQRSTGVLEQSIAARERARIDLAGATAHHAAAVQEAAVRGASVDGISDDDVRAEAAQLHRLRGAVDRWTGAIGDVERARLDHDRRRSDLAAALASAGLVDESAALAAALDETEINALEQRVAQWRTDLRSVDERLAELAGQGVPASRPDVDSLAERARVLGVEATALGTVLTRIEQRCHDARIALDHARDITAGSAALRERSDVARTVMLTCTGQIGQRVMFETWVLAAELDRVTSAATVHLQRMSAGRYALRRGASVVAGNRRTGLDLLVFDAHTGRERVPATLSGGERFQASLALALGLADVVSQGGTGSGRVFEALFVDEGFGSLDPDALDDAIEALQHLHATGRMVGVITHVEAMKQQLRTGIEVRLRDDGRGATIVQAADLIGAAGAFDAVTVADLVGVGS